MSINKENELIWEAFSSGQVQEEGLFKRKTPKGMREDPKNLSDKRREGDSYKSRERDGVVTQSDQDQLKRDRQGEAGDSMKDYAEVSGVAAAFTDTMDDYGYSDDDYAEDLFSPRHPDNIEREKNPKHNYIRKPGVSDNYTDEDRVLDHKGNAIRRSSLGGVSSGVIRAASQHERNQ
tara:strand:- start:440 stop:970 length:531 start_codon:yes stop_codon:yes gene_type:complete